MLRFLKRSNDPVEELDTAESADPTQAALRPVWRIGRTTRIHGDVSAAVDISIDGDFVGTLNLLDHRLSTGAASRVSADVAAHSVVIRGRIDGNLTATDRVTLTRTAEVHGDISAPNVTFAPGCRFRGRIAKYPEDVR